MSKRNICDMHKEIQKIIYQIYRIKPSDYENTDDLKDEIEWHIRSIESEVDEALEAGQSMEDRLLVYKVAIEDLGFKRVK
jgi:hypothetical protein